MQLKIIESANISAELKLYELITTDVGDKINELIRKKKERTLSQRILVEAMDSKEKTHPIGQEVKQIYFRVQKDVFKYTYGERSKD